MITLVLRHRLIFNPPMLSDVAKVFKGYESLSRLYELVKEYTPTEREVMLALTPTGAAQHFADAFSKRYFPLDDYRGVEVDYGLLEERNQYALNRLFRHIPCSWRGMTRSRYDSTWQRVPPGELIAKVICACPWEGDDRLAVLDGFKDIVKNERKSESILKRLPSRGYKLKEIEAALEDSAFPGLIDRCRWVFGATGNIWLDAMGETTDREWSRENVERLTRDWPLCKEIEKKMDAFDSWSGHDMPARCAEVVDYMAKRKGARGDKAKR